MFWVNGTFVRWIGDSGKRKISYLEYALGGSLTWASCTLLECPLQLASSQMQVQIVRLKADPAFKPEFVSVAGVRSTHYRLQCAASAALSDGLTAMRRCSRA